MRLIIPIAGVISGVISIALFLGNFIPDVVECLIISCLIFLVIVTGCNTYIIDHVRRGLRLHDSFAQIVLTVSMNIISEYINKKVNIIAEEFIKSIVKNLNNAVHEASKILLEHQKELTPEDIKDLLRKYEEGKLNLKEAETLRKYLEEEEKRRRQAGDIYGALLVGILLLGVLAFIATLIASKHED